MSYEPNSGILDELRPFFYPRSIAVVGVSKNPAAPGTSMVRALQRFGYEGKIYPVNPRLKELMGLAVYPSISDIPGEVDFARVYIPTSVVPDVVRECRRKGIGAVEIFTGGFSEIGTDDGIRLEAELTAMAGQGMRIVGPNCFGVYSPGGGVTQIPGEHYPREKGCVGFLSQSGGLSEDIFRYAVDYGINFSKGISYGNGCDVSEVDLLQYFESDSDTRIVGAYLEGVKKGEFFVAAVRRITEKKPVIIWKGGLTPSGAKTAASHTGSMAGDERIWPAFLRQTGAVQVHGVEDFLDTLSAFAHLPPQKDLRVALICGGGGTGVAFSDACYREGLVLPDLSKDLKEKISRYLAPLGTSAHNPIDVGPPFPPGVVLENIMELLATSGQVGSIILEKVSPSLRLRQVLGYSEQMGWEEKPGLSEIPIKIAKKHRLPVIVILHKGGDRSGSFDVEKERRELRDYYLNNGVGVFPTADRALRALRRMIQYYKNCLRKADHIRNEE